MREFKEMVHIPPELFVKIFGTYVPRLCVDVAVIGPRDEFKVVGWGKDLSPRFEFNGQIALRQRNEEPRTGQWGMPGGMEFKDETHEDAARRHVKQDLGIEIDVIGSIGHVEFLNNSWKGRIPGQEALKIHDSAVIVLARARSSEIASPVTNVRWFSSAPDVPHVFHIPFLQTCGLLPQ